MGNGAAVSFKQLQMVDEERRFIINVAPNSMKPKDEITQQNLATQLFQGESLDPLTFFEEIDDADPQETALRLMTYKTNPQQYIAQYLSPEPQQQQATGQPPQTGAIPNETGEAPQTMAAPASSASLPTLQGNTQPQI
jgi:hypothetical protein